MIPIIPHYCGMHLDRKSAERNNHEWVNQQLDSEHAVFLPLLHSRTLVTSQDDECISVHYIEKNKISDLLSFADNAIYLGHNQHAPVFALDLSQSEIDESAINDSLQSVDVYGTFTDLRKVVHSIPPRDAAISAYARGIAHWHQANPFCSRCGHPSLPQRGGHMRQCTNPSCQNETFPRTDPAVIMLVEQLEPADGIAKCLLGRHQALPQGIYSTLAGFVDPGENLEEAVAREVKEEAGIQVNQVDYLASQPWPFPSSIMIGFQAKTVETDISVDQDELEDAQWFTADEIRSFSEPGDSSNTFALPGKDSIARILVETWLNENS